MVYFYCTAAILVSKVCLVCFNTWLIPLITELQTTKINKLWVYMEALTDLNNMNYELNALE